MLENLKYLPEIPKPLTIAELLQIFGSTIKRDNINKLVTFLCMLCAYTEESQSNVSYRAPSSTGKSYIPIELAAYFPPEDVMFIAYSSPTAFFHDAGEWDDEKKALVINLERKILIFLDQPHDELLRRLRPLLSHDKKELLVKITDKREKRGLRTKNVIIKGFPSVIFCTGSLKIDEQEMTRNFILSPETTQEKIRESLYLKALRKGNPIEFQKFLESKPEREELRQRIARIELAQVKHIIIPDVENLLERFIEGCSKLKPRHNRDLERLISLIQGLALLNLWHRKRDENGNIIASEEDIENGFRIWTEIAECQELGIPPYVFSLFQEVILPLHSEKRCPMSRKEILAKHYEVYGRMLSDSFLRKEILPILESAGLIAQVPDPEDRRLKLVQVATYFLEYSCFSKKNQPLGKNRFVEGGVGVRKDTPPSDFLYLSITERENRIEIPLTKEKEIENFILSKLSYSNLISIVELQSSVLSKYSNGLDDPYTLDLFYRKLEELKQKGEIYDPKPGFLLRVMPINKG